jgi:hypothetical protein
MENDNLHLKSTSDEQPAWVGEINLDEILSKYGPEGCHEIADKLIEIANDDMKNALAEGYGESINKIEWFEHPKEPFLNTAVVVELDDGKLGIAQLDDNSSRKCWLIQGTGKMFWRSMFEKIEKWRWMTGDEMVEYHVDRTLKIIENDKKTEI